MKIDSISNAMTTIITLKIKQGNLAARIRLILGCSVVQVCLMISLLSREFLVPTTY